jgi:hypothetical protein
MFSRYICFLSALPTIASAADDVLHLTSRDLAEGLVRRQTEVAVAAPSTMISVENNPIVIQTQIVIGSAIKSVPAIDSANTIASGVHTSNSRSDAALVFQPPETLLLPPLSTTVDLQSVLFAPPTQSITSTAITPWTVPLDMPPQSLPTLQPPPASPVQPSQPPLESHVPLKGPVMAAYYPDWAEDQLPPEKIDFSKLDWVDFGKR